MRARVSRGLCQAAGEATTKAPVACPKCWQVTQVPVASEAAQHEDYRAEAV